PRAIQKGRILDANAFVKFCGSPKERERLQRVIEKTGVVFVEMLPDTPKHLKKEAKNLYYAMFPNRLERDEWEAIEERVAMMARLPDDASLQERFGKSRFHAILALSGQDVVGYGQFTTIPVASDVAVYGQYGCVASSNYMKRAYGRDDDFRRQQLDVAFYPMTYGIAAQDTSGRVVGTIMESEMIGQGRKRFDMWFSRIRLQIHKRNWVLPVMLEMGDGTLMNPWLQPALGDGKQPYFQHILYRPSSFEGFSRDEISALDPSLAKSLLTSLAGNFRCEGYDPTAALRIIDERFSMAKRVLLVPPDRLPNIVELAEKDPLLAAQAKREYGRLDRHAKKIADVLENGPIGPIAGWARQVGLDALTLFNPISIFNKAKANIRAFREAKSVKDSDIVGKPDIISAKLTAKLLAAVGICEFVGTYLGAWTVGIWLQEHTKNAYWGVAGSAIGDYVLSTLAFGPAWLALNIGYYSNSAKTFIGKVGEVLRDNLRFNAIAFLPAMAAYAVGSALSSGLIALANYIYPHIAEKVHIMPLISEVLNFAAAETIFLALASKGAGDVLGKLKQRYTAYLERRFGTAGDGSQ
ncbi:MAG: hypothetical protein PHV13_04920, partial [Candidatus ainarchaeum sp.]|nr:hypothetical protein [Candidatus ainarchaeum sp.]